MLNKLIEQYTAENPLSSPDDALVIGYDQGGQITLDTSAVQRIEVVPPGAILCPSGWTEREDGSSAPLGPTYWATDVFVAKLGD